jgi:zinc transport system substrate-binding protein
MKKTYSFVSAFLLMSIVIGLILGACTPIETPRLKVVTSTYLIATIVERVGGNIVEVVNIIPSGQHPGNFNTKPSDIQSLADADLFLIHGWPGEKFVPNLIASANNADLTVVRIEIEGNWMIPQVHLAATEKVTNNLSQVDSRNSPTYQKSVIAYNDKIITKETEIKAKLAEGNLTEVNVICAFWQAGFVRWTGFNVVATYGDPDSLTPKVIKELVDKGREAGVTLIIDNLQSGKDAGKGIAEELGCERVILSNFPGGFDNTETWEKAIDRNIELLLETAAQ